MSFTLGAHVTSSQLRSIQPIPRLGARISATSTEYEADTNCPHGKTRKSEGLNFGNDWYRQTKVPRRTVRDELERRRDANFAANKGRDREDLYTDKWAGSEYKGSKFNILTVILIVSVLTPLFGIIFAYFSYGRLWG